MSINRAVQADCRRYCPALFKISGRILENMDDETKMDETIQQIKEDISFLKAQLAEREAALPAHSVRPHQIMAIEDLEEEISMKQEILEALEKAGL